MRLVGAREQELVEPHVCIDRLLEVVRPRRLAHQPDLLREVGEVPVVHAIDRLRDAELLEGEAHGDEHLVHLLVGDAEHDSAAIRIRDDEALVLELPQRFAYRTAARLQLARDLVLDQPLAVLELAGDDRFPQRLDHLGTAGAASRRFRRYC